jgi:hypothetical protein
MCKNVMGIGKVVFTIPILRDGWAAILETGPRLAWIVILSVYGADTIAVDLSLSALISLFEINFWVLKQF